MRESGNRYNTMQNLSLVCFPRWVVLDIEEMCNARNATGQLSNRSDAKNSFSVMTSFWIAEGNPLRPKSEQAVWKTCYVQVNVCPSQAGLNE